MKKLNKNILIEGNHMIKKLIEDKLNNFNQLTLNEIYGEKVINTITKKFNDNSEDMINKLAIASLFRDVFFDDINKGDINKDDINKYDINKYETKEQFDKVYNNWYEKTLNDLDKTKTFVDNKELAKKYLDAYINNIKSLGNKAVPFSIKKVESGLVDVVNNNRWVDDATIKSVNDIYNPNDKDVLYEDDDIVILNTDTKAKCVMYGQGESWCITKPELNYYNTYRLSYGATPYFVLQKKVEGNEHKIVIMNYGNGNYAIADRSNSGDRAGGKNNSMSWVNIESKLPNLKGKEQYFKYREITEDEKKYEELIQYTKGYKGDNLLGFINEKIKELVINGSKVTSNDFIRDYAASGAEITDNQLKSLDEGGIDTLIEVGFFIRGRFNSNPNISEILSPKQLLRNIRIKIKNNIKLSGDEFILLSKEEQSKYISNIDSDGILNLLRYSKEPEKIINILGEKGKQFISNITSDGIYNLLRYSKEPEKIKSLFIKFGKSLDENKLNKNILKEAEGVVSAKSTKNPEGKNDNTNLNKTKKDIEDTEKELDDLNKKLKELDDTSNKLFGTKSESVRNVKKVIKVSSLSKNNISESKEWRKNKTKDSLYSSGIKERMHYEIEERLLNGNHPLSESKMFPDSYDISTDASLIIKEFEYSVKKCHEAFGVDNINNIKLYETMGKLLNEIKELEKPNKKKLEELAKNIVINEFNIPEGAIEFKCDLVDGLKPIKPKKKNKIQDEVVFESSEQITEAIYALDKQKGIYALAEGAVDNAINLYKNNDELVDINPQLSNKYNKIMYGAKYLNYVTDNDDEKIRGGDYSCEFKKNSDETITPIITVKAIAFPILVQELYRGVMEVLSTHGISDNEVIQEYVLNNDDYAECQPWYSKFGPRIWKKFCGNISNEDNNLKYEVYANLIKETPNNFFNAMKEIIGGTRKGKLIVDGIIGKIKENKEKEKYHESMSHHYFDKDELI